MEDTAAIMQHVVSAGGSAVVIVNNRSGGNAPMIAQQIARRFLALSHS
ncbi:MAG TPA: hypothetical protein PKJ77_01955 [Thermodesulfobacteriota bacterium]|nr:hypothetical protein [Thermodesulfobacteriota bacterium]